MILTRSEIVLSESQKKMVRNGWGEEIIEKIAVEKIVYDSDGLEVDGYLAYPGVLNGKLPLIIWNRGGNRLEGAIDEFLATGMFGEIASWGYVVLTSQYRKDDEFGGKDVNDILNLLTVAESLEFCNTDLIGMEGWSRGGMMTYRVLTMTDKIKCAVIVSGLANLNRWEKDRMKLSDIYPEIFGGPDESDIRENLKNRSAVNFAETICPVTAILLIHGTDDNTVSCDDSVEMNKLLCNKERDLELRIIEGGDHYLRKFRKEVSELRKEWFRNYLQK